MRLEIVPMGDVAIRISFGKTINEKTNHLIRQYCLKLEKAKINGVTEWVPSYTAVTVYYRPELISYRGLREELEKIQLDPDCAIQERPLVYEIPVCYGGELGPDLGFVAHYHGLSELEVVNLHANQEYLIYMMGFMPGFPYLGGLSEKLAVPRLESPRYNVLPGSVGIGGQQTGIYPADVPSGWRIIGATPIPLFDPEKDDPFLFHAGNYIKFMPVDQDEFYRIKALGKSYKVKTYIKVWS
jgi:inhibitor of KinA